MVVCHPFWGPIVHDSLSAGEIWFVFEVNQKSPDMYVSFPTVSTVTANPLRMVVNQKRAFKVVNHPAAFRSLECV